MTSWLQRDALNRAWRTVLQGIVAIVLVPAVDAAIQVAQRDVLGMFRGEPFDWRRTLTAAAVAAITGGTMAITAYLHRLKLDPSSVPSAQPPRSPGSTAAQAPATSGV
jgi:hypothetical protein